MASEGQEHVRAMTARVLRLQSVLVAALAAGVGCGSSVHGATLQDALRLALERSPALASARAEERAAQAERGLADAAAGPHLGLGASYTYLDRPTLFGGMTVFARETQVNMVALRASVYDRSLSLRRRAASLAASARGTGVRAAEEAVLLQVAERYWAVAAAKQHEEAAADAARFLKANLERVVASQQAGAATRGEVLRAQAEEALARDRLLAAQNGVRVALSALKMAIGLDQDEEFDVSADALLPDERVQTAEPADSPAVTSARQALAAAEAALAAARAGNDPTLTLDADFQNIARGAEFPRRDGTVSAMVRLNIPIFDSGATQSAVAKAAAERDRAASQLKAAEDQVAFQRRSTELALQSALERWRATEEQVAAAMESRRLVEIGAREGIYTQTDLLSAQSAVSAAQASRIQSLADLKTAEAARLAAISRLDILLDMTRR
jgi:outer membrane protein TolC